jgi:uncharacterized ubiquitin-like protein YukD
LRIFVEYIFGTDGDGIIKLTPDHPIGKMINSMWSVSDLPLKDQEKHNIKVYLPVTSSNHHISKYNFIFVTRWKQEQIQIFIEAQYDLYLREMFTAGRECGFSKERIIEAILIDLNQRKNFFTYDQLKKFDYRNRRKTIENIQRMIKENCK